MNYKDVLENLFAIMQSKEGASDLLLSSDIPPSIRVNGELNYVGGKGLSSTDVKEIINLTMDDDQRGRYEEKLDIDYSYGIGDKGRYRVNAFCTIKGFAVNFRKIPEIIPKFEEIRAPEILKKFAEKKQGLVLMVGPTGSGKSTTLAATIDHINNTYKKHIITIEDPVEFTFKSKNSVVNQRQVGSSTESFPIALKSSLREDPDVIMVGEMRDLETVSLALSAAETGHLVFSTLHTNSAYDAINRIIDVFPADSKGFVKSLLSNSLLGVVSQRLVRSKDGSKRYAVHEVLVATPAVKNLIKEGNIAQIYSMMQVGAKHGMITLKDSIDKLLEQDLVDRDEVSGLTRESDNN